MKIFIFLIALLLAGSAFADDANDTRMYCISVGNATQVIGGYRATGHPPQEAFDMTKKIFGKWLVDYVIKAIVNDMYFNPASDFNHMPSQVTAACMAINTESKYQPLK